MKCRDTAASIAAPTPAAWRYWPQCAAGRNVARKFFRGRRADEAEDIFDDEITIRDRRLIVRDQQAKVLLHALVDRLRAAADGESLPSARIVVRRKLKQPVIVQTRGALVSTPRSAKGNHPRARKMPGLYLKRSSSTLTVLISVVRIGERPRWVDS